MSTKIHNGYKHRNLPETIHNLAKLKPILFEFANIKTQQILARTACTRLDAGESDIFKKLEAELHSAQCSQYRTNPDLDFQLSIHFFHHKIAGWLSLLHTEQSHFVQLFKKHCKVTPFEYWNNEDKPNNITQEHWDSRGKIWHTVLQSTELQWALYPDKTQQTYVNKEEIIKNQPTYEQRLHKHTQRLVTDRKYAELVKENSIGWAFNLTIEWITSPEGETAIEDEKQHQNLKEKYEIADL
jgi:hypothetical protein